jgi:hypothetical protein
MTGLSEYLNVIVGRWRREGIPIRPGVAATSIAAFESRYRVTVPDDMREYFLTVDGTGEHYDDDGFVRFWPLHEVQPIDRYRPELAGRYPDVSEYFLFFDHSIDLFMYAIHLQKNPLAPNPIARLYPQEDVIFEPAFRSFTEIIISYANSPSSLF